VGHRVDNVENIATAIRGRVPFEPTMEIMDFGSGTGLLLERVAPLVRKICAVDTSPSMNAQLADKAGSLGCELEILEVDLTVTRLERRFDGIISSMTLHHVENVGALFQVFHGLLNDGGFLALADLVTEDGSFHPDNEGVHHFGFDRDALIGMARDAGFRDPEVATASILRKPHGDFPVFLLTAIR
jgi:cyclopropane fatty-acyl-phospholipid synthase-like methyltransferase